MSVEFPGKKPVTLCLNGPKLTNCDAKIGPVADGVNLTRDIHADQRDVGFRQRQRVDTVIDFVLALRAGRVANL